MRVDVSPDALDVEPGRQAYVSVAVFNDGPVIAAYRVRVLGLDPSWVSIDEPRLSLFPDTSGAALVALDLPRDAPAGARRVGIEVTSLDDAATTEVVEIELTTPVEPEARLEIEPVSIYGTGTGTFGVLATNEGNTPLDLTFEAVDTEDHLHFEFEPPTVALAPGERTHVQVVAKGRRPFLGSPVPRQFTVHGRHPDIDPFAMGSLVQRPWLSRGALSLLGLLAAVTVFAAVLTNTLGRVVDRSTANEEVLLDVIRGERDGEAVTNPGSVAGTVTLLTSGAPVNGVTAEIFGADATDQAVATTATDVDGAFQFGDLEEGTYLLRFRGAGFTEVWYPAAVDAADATEVEVTAGEQTAGLDVRLGGVPGSISGTVVGEDPGGGLVTLRVAADVIDGPVDAVVASTAVDATGEFTLENVPAPTTYELFVDKPGFASEVRRVNIAAGEAVEGIEVSLRRGDGSITGRAFDGDGALGGATVTATNGDLTVTTATLTQDDPGRFFLRDLPTPATYTVEVAAPGHVAETFAVRLGPGEQLEGVSATLRRSEGSISGTVSAAGSGPAGGVLVTVSDGDVTATTRSLSVGDVGAWQVDGLPLPGTYTVTFSRDDLAPQTRSIDMDAIGAASRTGVDATLVPAQAEISGQVTDELTGPLGGVQVTASSGDRTYSTVSAHQPPGRYELGGLPPGTYTVTFERSGSQPRAVLVTLDAGESRSLDTELEPQATIRGRVTVGGAPTGGLLVRLYRVEAYPQTFVATTTTEADGTFHFPALDAPRTYIVEFTNASGAAIGSAEVPLSAGEQRTGVNFDAP